MKTTRKSLPFVGGACFGLALALCLGAADKAAEAPKTDWSRLKVYSYPSGTTGFFDPDAGTLYVYDINLDRCVYIRELKTLGQPLIRR